MFRAGSAPFSCGRPEFRNGVKKSFREVGRRGLEVSPRRHSDMEEAMSAIDIAAIAPEQTRLHEDGELVAELFRDESAFDQEPAVYVFDLSDDPHGPKRICLRDHRLAAARWTVDPCLVR